MELVLVIFVMTILSLASVAYAENIDPCNDGSQYAYGGNIGWIHFQVQGTSIVDWHVLANFVDDWLVSGTGLPGDLSGNDEVDFVDYGIFADYWLDYCPPDWPLK